MTRHEIFMRLLTEANCRDLAQAKALGTKAITLGDPPEYVVDCLRRNQPGLFYRRAKR